MSQQLDRDKLAEALPNYEVEKELGRGAWGVVLAGRHRQLDRPVAIKQLPHAFSADEGVRARFLAEAQVLASLTHPHIVPIYDYVEHEGLCLLVMEQLTGGTVWSRFTEDGITSQGACAVLLATCAALDYAHERDVLHRDIKPENLMFSRDGMLKVADFGIAKVLTGTDEALATRAGDIMGTPAYMAPEQAKGVPLGPPADIYASGVMLYELLTGRLPFSGEGGALSMVYQRVHEDPVPITDVAEQVPAGLAAVVMRSIARETEDRYATAEEFGVALGQAATSSFGAGWLERTEVPVLAPGPIQASTLGAYATAEPSAPPQDAEGRGTVVGESVAGQPVDTPDDTGAPGTDAAEPTPTPPTAGSEAPTAPPGQDAAARGAAAPDGPRVRPDAESAAHRKAGGPENVDVADLVPVREAIEQPSFPIASTLLAVALLLVMLGVAFAGPAAEWRDEALQPGTVEVDGVDPATGRIPTVDLAEPVPIRVSPDDAEAVEVHLSVADIPLGSSREEPVQSDDGVALVSLSGARYVAASNVTADLRLLRGGEEAGTYRFGIRNSQQPFLTLPGALVVAAVLFTFAYAESFLRHMRRGRRRFSGTLGMVVVGAVGGVAALGLAWLAGGREPLPASALGVAALGTAAGLVAAFAAVRAGKRKRAHAAARAGTRRTAGAKAG